MQNHTVITHRVPSHRTGIPEDMDRLATFLEANPFASAMMIHQGPHGEQRGVAGGTKVSGSYFGASTYASESTMVPGHPAVAAHHYKAVSAPPAIPWVHPVSRPRKRKAAANNSAKTSSPASPKHSASTVPCSSPLQTSAW